MPPLSLAYLPPNGTLCTLWLNQIDLVMVAPKRWEAQVVNASWEQLADLPRISTQFYCPFDAVGDRLFQQRGLTSRRPAVNADDDQTEPRIGDCRGGDSSVPVKDDVESAVHKGGKVAQHLSQHRCRQTYTLSINHARGNEPAIRAICSELLKIWKPPLLSPRVNGVHH